MKETLTIVKIGGNIIDNPQVLPIVLKEFSAIPGKKILVHGGGKIASEMSEKLGVQPKMIDGRRITDAATLEVVTMVYGGLVNKNIVAGLQHIGADAIGLTGADANIIPAHKRHKGDIDYGFVGDVSISDINAGRLVYFTQGGLIPVICALTHDGQGHLLNTNADTIASSLAIRLAENYDVELIYCFDKPGVLLDINDDKSLVNSLTLPYYEQLKNDGIIHQGMLPKLENAFLALQKGVRVTIKHALNLNNPIGTELQ